MARLVVPQAFHAERHCGDVNEVRADRQDAEQNDCAGADPHETIRPGRQQESREYQNGSREGRKDDPRQADDNEDDRERPDQFYAPSCTGFSYDVPLSITSISTATLEPAPKSV